MDEIKLYVRKQGGQETEITDTTTREVICDLLVTPFTAKGFAVATNENHIRNMGLTDGIYHAKGINAKKEPVDVELNKKKVAEFATKIRELFAMKEHIESMRVVKGDLGKRGAVKKEPTPESFG